MAKINKKSYRAFIVPHTHWDREWYQTFQQFRIRLIDLINNLIDILEKDKAFSDFTLDGQTIVLEDYLEVCPEKRRILKNISLKAEFISVPGIFSLMNFW